MVFNAGMPCLGGAISKDIKHTIIPYLDYVHPDAATVQSVNTVIVKDMKLYGYNTDMVGFSEAIKAKIAKENLTITSAVCYGYGGVVSVVIAVLKSLGINKIYITGRNLVEAKKRAETFGVLAWNEDVTESIDLFVNAAPVTDKPLHEAKNFLESLKTCKVVFDHEMPGKYLKQYCEDNNIVHIPGTDMYYPQMMGQWKLFLESYGIEDDKLIALLKEADEKTK